MPKRHRKATKAKPRLFKLLKKVDKFVVDEAKRTGKDMVEILEETLQFRMKFKKWPPFTEKEAE